MSFDSFLSDFLATILGAAASTLLFFLFREKIYGFDNIDGSWVYEQKTIESDYNPYIGMTVCFLVLLIRDGNRIYGSAEKIYDITADEEKREYVGKYRSIAEVSGSIEKRYLSKDIISLHLSEKGEIRNSSTFHKLSAISKNELSGRFYSTVANQMGTVTWKKRSS